jgi:hypothetical protein
VGSCSREVNGEDLDELPGSFFLKKDVNLDLAVEFLEASFL